MIFKAFAYLCIFNSFAFISFNASAAESVGIENGVTHSAVKNQESSEICWAYVMASLAEGEYLKSHPNSKIHISPEYLGFYHIYFQLKNHLGYFKELTMQLSKAPEDEKERLKQVEIEKAYLALKDSSTDFDIDKPENELFKPDMGSFGNTALEEVALIGMVPEENFPLKLQSPELQEDLVKKLPLFIGSYMLDLENLIIRITGFRWN